MKEMESHLLPRYFSGMAATGLALYFMATGREDPVILAASLFLAIICLTDTFQQRIPNVAVLLLIIAGFSIHLIQAGASGLLTSFQGMALGFGLLILPYAMGGMGAGDVKALAALGSLLGPAQVFEVFLYTGLFGGIMALCHYALSQNFTRRLKGWGYALLNFCATRKMETLLPSDTSEKLRFPYAAAFAYGYFAFLSWGGILT